MTTITINPSASNHDASQDGTGAADEQPDDDGH